MLGMAKPSTPAWETSDDRTPTHDRPGRRLRHTIRRQRSPPRQNTHQPDRRTRSGRRVRRQRGRLGLPRPTQEQKIPRQGNSTRRPLRAHQAGRPARNLCQARHGRPAAATRHDPGDRTLARRTAGGTGPPRRDPDRHRSATGAGRFSSRASARLSHPAIQPRPGPCHPLQQHDHGPAYAGPVTQPGFCPRALPCVCHGRAGAERTPRHPNPNREERQR